MQKNVRGVSCTSLMASFTLFWLKFCSKNVAGELPSKTPAGCEAGGWARRNEQASERISTNQHNTKKEPESMKKEEEEYMVRKERDESVSCMKKRESLPILSQPTAAPTQTKHQLSLTSAQVKKKKKTKRRKGR